VELKPKPERLLDITMRVLAEEERLESLLLKAEVEEREEIEKALNKIKDMRRSLLRVYFSSALLGRFKAPFVPAVTALGRKDEWLAARNFLKRK